MIGIDEVGRGCWAGPLLVVAARPIGAIPDGLRDSKQLTKKQRNSIFQALISSFQFGEGWVGPDEIDELGLAQAMRLGVERALTALRASPDEHVILDGTVNYCPNNFTNVRCQAKADQTEPIVSAASIYAKVTRDRHMAEQAAEFPHYGFEKHVGYGTAAHIAALKQFGICRLHRVSYKPVGAFAQ